MKNQLHILVSFPAYMEEICIIQGSFTVVFMHRASFSCECNLFVLLDFHPTRNFEILSHCILSISILIYYFNLHAVFTFFDFNLYLFKSLHLVFSFFALLLCQFWGFLHLFLTGLSWVSSYVGFFADFSNLRITYFMLLYFGTFSWGRIWSLSFTEPSESEKILL